MTTIRITGTLLRNAYSACGTDGSAWVVVDVGQSPGSPPCRTHVHARRPYGHGHAAQFAAANAVHHLRRGAQVTVHATGYDIRHTPNPHLLLLGVELIEHLHLEVQAAPTEQEHAA